jgi:hypothetical protein
VSVSFVKKGRLGCDLSENCLWCLEQLLIAYFLILFCRHFMISGLKGYGVKDLTKYLMEQVCSFIPIIIFFPIEFTVSVIRDFWTSFYC